MSCNPSKETKIDNKINKDNKTKAKNNEIDYNQQLNAENYFRKVIFDDTPLFEPLNDDTFTIANVTNNDNSSLITDDAYHDDDDDKNNTEIEIYENEYYRNDLETIVPGKLLISNINHENKHV
jgi:hypothetical protein